MLSSKPSSCSDIIDQTPKPLILRAKTVEINKEFKKFLHSPKTINEFKFSNNINKYNNNNKQINVFDTYSPLKQNKLNDKINLIKNFTFDSNESSLLSISENSSSILSTPPSNKNKIIKMPNNEKKKRFVRKYISPPNSKNSNKINEDNNKNKNKLFTSLFDINDNNSTSPFNDILNINKNKNNNNNLSSLFYEHCENPEKNNNYANNIFDKINNIINQINQKKYVNKFNIYVIKEDCSIEDIEYDKFIKNLFNVIIYEKEGILSQDNKFYIPANIKCDLNFNNIKNDDFEGRLIFQIINNDNFIFKNNNVNNKTILNDNNYNYDLLSNDITSKVELFSMEIQLF